MSDFVSPWTVAGQDSLSMGISRQEYWSGLPCPSPGNLPNPGIEPGSPVLQPNSLPSEPPDVQTEHQFSGINAGLTVGQVLQLR